MKVIVHGANLLMATSVMIFLFSPQGGLISEENTKVKLMHLPLDLW